MAGSNELQLASRTILIAEDNLLIAMEIEQALEQHGAKVWICSNADDARQALVSRSFDFALIDYIMNDEPNIALIGAISENGIPYALLTGYPVKDIDPRANALTIFLKPFREEDIVNHILGALG